MRHGAAQYTAVNDRERRLTLEGRSQVQHVCEQQLESLVSVDLLAHSPFLRAVETAGIVRSFLGDQVNALQNNNLVPNASVDTLIEYLYELSNEYQHVLLVSHQPLVGSLLHSLTGAQYGRYHFGTASLANLTCDPLARDCCELNWLIHP